MCFQGAFCKRHFGSNRRKDRQKIDVEAEFYCRQNTRYREGGDINEEKDLSDWLKGVKEPISWALVFVRQIFKYMEFKNI